MVRYNNTYNNVSYVLTSDGLAAASRLICVCVCITFIPLATNGRANPLCCGCCFMLPAHAHAPTPTRTARSWESWWHRRRYPPLRATATAMASLRRDEDSGPHGGPVVAPFRIWHFLLCYMLFRFKFQIPVTPQETRENKRVRVVQKRFALLWGRGGRVWLIYYCC